MQDHPSLFELLAKTERDENIIDTLEKFKVHSKSSKYTSNFSKWYLFVNR